MSLEEFENNIELRVFVLAIYKKKSDETIKDVIITMEDSNVFTQKTAKKYVKLLKSMELLNEDGLTLLGVQKAKSVELEFKL